MTEARNLTSHTYIEEVARTVYEQVPEFAGLMRGRLTVSMRARLEGAASLLGEGDQRGDSGFGSL